MQLVLGLGNPGRRYRDTRHNIGFRCVEAVAGRLGLPFVDAAAEYREAVGDGPGGALTLLQPLTYMNLSGNAVRAWALRHGLRVGAEPDVRLQGGDTPSVDAEPVETPDIVPVVVCDDLHLALGSIRIRESGSDGGQNGLASILIAAGGEAVPRMRLGVGPLCGAVPADAWADYVLEDFAPDEQDAVDDLVERSADALLCLLEMGATASGSRYNRRIRPSTDLLSDDR